MSKLKNSLEIFRLSLLNDFPGSGILDTDSVLDMLMSSKRNQVRKIHSYAITPPSKEGGRWQTSYQGADGKRKNIKAQTEEELLDKLVLLYFSDSHIDKMTFHGLYKDCLLYTSPSPRD